MSILRQYAFLILSFFFSVNIRYDRELVKVKQVGQAPKSVKELYAED